MFKTELIKIISTLHLTALDALGLLCIDIDIYGNVTSYCTSQTEADQRGEEAAQPERCWRLADRAAARDRTQESPFRSPVLAELSSLWMGFQPEAPVAMNYRNGVL